MILSLHSHSTSTFSTDWHLPWDSKTMDANSEQLITARFKFCTCRMCKTLSIWKHKKPPITQRHLCRLSDFKCQHRHEQIRYHQRCKRKESWVALKSQTFKTFLASEINFVHSISSMPQESQTQLKPVYKKNQTNKQTKKNSTGGKLLIILLYCIKYSSLTSLFLEAKLRYSPCSNMNQKQFTIALSFAIFPLYFGWAHGVLFIFVIFMLNIAKQLS